MQLSQPVRHHKTTSQQQRLELHIERMIEERRIQQLKATLQKKMEAKAASPEKIQAA